jgi:hypothetical protein
MNQRTRFIIAIAVLGVIIAGVLGINALRRRASTVSAPAGEMTVPPGAIPITVDGTLVGSFTPADLEELEIVSFVDDEEGKTQEGWMLRDVLGLHVDTDALDPETTVTVISTSRDKSATLTWAEVDDPDNFVLFDISASRGTLKLVSVLPQLDVRDEWIQDVDQIEIVTP